MLVLVFSYLKVKEDEKEEEEEDWHYRTLLLVHLEENSASSG